MRFLIGVLCTYRPNFR